MSAKLQVTCILLLCSLLAFADSSWVVFNSGSFQGLATKEGEVVIPAVYDAIGWTDGSKQVVDGFVGYRERDTWGLINIKNKRITNPDYTILTPFDQGRFRAAVKGRFSNQLFYGLLDAKGDVKIDFRYFSLEHFDKGLLLVSEYRNQNTFYGVIDAEGKLIVPKAFESLEIKDDLIVGKSKRRYKLYNLSGDELFDHWLDGLIKNGEDYIVSFNGKVGLVTSSGQVIHHVEHKRIDDQKAFPFRTWQVIDIESEEEFWIECDSLSYASESLFTIHLNGKKLLWNPGYAESLSESDYDLKLSFDSLLLMQNRRTLKWGLFTAQGAEVLIDKDSLVVDREYVYVLNAGRWDIYSTRGVKINSRSVDRVMGSQHGKIAVKNHGYWGWLDKLGDPLIFFRYDKIRFGLKEDQFICKYVDRWGVSNFRDEVIIPHEYDQVKIVGNYYVATRKSASSVFDPNGNLIQRLAGEIIGDSVLIVSDDGKYGLILSSGKTFYPEYDTITVIGSHYVAQLGAHMIMIDSEGNDLISLTDEYQDISEFQDGYFKIKKDGLYGFVDQEGKLRIANRYEDVQSFSDGMAAVKLLGKWGFVDESERLVVQPFYDEVGAYIDGLAVVRIGDKLGIIDKNGNEVIELMWKEIVRQPTGNFVVADFNGLYGMVDKAGQTILTNMFQLVKDCSNQVVIVQKNDLRGVLDYKGYNEYPFKYDDIVIEGRYILLLDEKLY